MRRGGEMVAVEVAASWRLFVLRWFPGIMHVMGYTNDDGDGVYPLRAKKENNVTRKNRPAADQSNDQRLSACMTLRTRSGQEQPTTLQRTAAHSAESSKRHHHLYLSSTGSEEIQKNAL
jgi:hypothetical protein